MKAAFGKGGRVEDTSMTWSKAKSKSIGNLEDLEETDSRSQSVPPTSRGKGKQKQVEHSVDEEEEYGAGGRLSVSKSDPTKFRVSIEGRKIDFGLSLVADSDDGRRGRRNRDGKLGRDSEDDINSMDDFEFFGRFEEGRIDIHTFLENDDIVDHPALVLKWSEGQ